VHSMGLPLSYWAELNGLDAELKVQWLKTELRIKERGQGVTGHILYSVLLSADVQMQYVFCLGNQRKFSSNQHCC
jgi:hypothetical protein